MDQALAQKYIEQYRIIRDMEAEKASGIGPSHSPESLKKFKECVEHMHIHPKTVLDFGSGSLGVGFINAMFPGPSVRKYAYDPGVPSLDSAKGFPRYFDLIFCLDVMEHIPESNVHGMLKLFQSMTDSAIFIIHHGPAAAILPNGENAHCTQKPLDWWLDKIRQAGFQYPQLFQIIATDKQQQPLRTLIHT